MKHQIHTYPSESGGWIAAVSSCVDDGLDEWGWESVYSGKTEEEAVSVAMERDSRADKLQSTK